METILIIDDDPIFCRIMKQHLTEMGYAVIENNSGIGVIQKIQEENPVACIIDIIMDDKEGIETIIEINKLPNKPKLIAVSSNGFYLKLAQRFGVDMTMTKPVTPQMLKETLIGLLE